MEPFYKKNKVLKVSQVNQLIGQTLEQQFPSVWIQGEISNFIAHSSGHWYFSLKDPHAQIKSVMFKGNNRRVAFAPKNGTEVLVHGQITVYSPRGNYQILCSKMEAVGAGALQKIFEELKIKLKQEGLFDSQYKKKLPSHPKHIGIITSPTGAALRDILQILRRRFKGLKITLIPALVQGEEAPASLIQALKQAEQIPSMDTLILTRGGGSTEDLSVFNDETLARTVFKTKIPIISAVGHEIDFTICDFVADLRAPTPSAAAELVVKNRVDLLEQVSKIEKQLIQGIQLQIKWFKERVNSLQKQMIHPKQLLQNYIQKTDEQAQKLYQIIKHLILREKNSLKNKEQLLNSLNPKEIMKRGFCIVSNSHGKVLSNVQNLKLKELISLEFFKGRAKASIVEKGN